MPDQLPPRRRFQFRLRTLLIVVALLAVPCWYVANEARIVRQRRAMTEGFEGTQVGISCHQWPPRSNGLAGYTVGPPIAG